MNRDKQIEEMCAIMSNTSYLTCEDAPLVPESAGICDKVSCHRCKEARLLMNAGYRKSTDVAEEIFAEIEKEIELALDSNYKVKRDAQDDNDSLVLYVEGKIDCLRGLLGFLAELKKKYIGEEK